LSSSEEFIPQKPAIGGGEQLIKIEESYVLDEAPEHRKKSKSKESLEVANLAVKLELSKTGKEGKYGKGLLMLS